MGAIIKMHTINPDFITQQSVEYKQELVNLILSGVGSERLALGAALIDGQIAYLNLFLEFPAFRDLLENNVNEMLGLASYFGHLNVVNCLLEIPAVRDDVVARCNAVKKAAQAAQAAQAARHPRGLRDHKAVVERLIENPDVLNRLNDDDLQDGEWLKDIIQNVVNKVNNAKKLSLEVVRSTYSDLKLSNEMAFPKEMNSDYATKYAIGILQ